MVMPLACKKRDQSAGLGREYRSFESPDRAYKIVVYRTPQEMVMPGQSGDAPGNVCLYDLRSGALLEQKAVEMVQLVSFQDISWSETNVSIKLFADWALPCRRTN